MKILKTANLRFYLNQIVARTYTTELYPYTSDLYKKNFIKYTVQSRQAIMHDYVYSGDERLPTLAERLKEFKDPLQSMRKNIGKNSKPTDLELYVKKIDEKIKNNKTNKQLEIDSREMKINVPLDEINKQYKYYSAFKYIQRIADHYNINKDIFENAFFCPSIDLKIEYSNKENNSIPVYYGNKITANETINKPKVNWEDVLGKENDNNRYHTLLFLNLDGNFNNNNNQVLLWFMGNIKKGDINSGNELIDYIQPFPMQGTGWHRCVYLLCEHQDPIDFHLKSNQELNNFSKRNFKCSDFFLHYQDQLTPVGLSFFQTEWDISVKKVFHEYLNMKEPIYEFKFDSKFIPKFEKYPRFEPPFNWYLQDYTDKKEINEQVMKEYLKQLTPFEYYPEPAKYPLIDLGRVKPRWYKMEEINRRKRRMQYNIIPFKYASPLNKFNSFIKNLPYQQK